jgi:4-aminobutyrate aminotransferase
MSIYRHIPSSINKIHGKILPVFAKDSMIYTSNNNKYLDLTSGIGALSTGHNHPYVIKKVTEQLNKYVHFPQQIFNTHPIQMEVTEKIIKTMPHKRLDNIFYVNSGSEAVDNAIKISKLYTKRQNIITMIGGFHGRTLGALSVTSSNLSCRKSVSPLLSNIYFCNDFTQNSIDKILEYQSAPSDTAAIILEPVQGEGGIFSFDKNFLRYIRNICDDNNILLIADEVQCGSMRTGTWWNIEQKNIIPDLMIFGKGIASGYPFAGIVSTSNIMNSLEPGNLGGTYGGNAICSAAASATIDILNSKEIKDNVTTLGEYIKQNLENEYMITNVRQYGLMIGIEFITSDYDPSVTKYILDELRKEGILVLFAGNKNQYIRVLPSLNIKKENINMFIEKFSYILSKIYL